jgi:hypothetical protein
MSKKIVVGFAFGLLMSVCAMDAALQAPRQSAKQCAMSLVMKTGACLARFIKWQEKEKTAAREIFFQRTARGDERRLHDLVATHEYRAQQKNSRTRKSGNGTYCH